MGPQLYRCGNRHLWRGIRRSRDRFNGAATLSLRKPAACLSFSVLVLVLQWGRNFSVAETRSRIGKSKECGLLQWGRNFIVAETISSLTSTTLQFTLQWGRNFIVAETSLPFFCTSHPSLSFNGAATLSLRKPAARPAAGHGSICFNGAATLSLRKRRLAAHHRMNV